MKIKRINGFTLIELLIATGIIAALSITSTKLLFDIVTVKAKQQTLEVSSDTVYTVTDAISRSIKDAKNINIPNPNKLELTGSDLCINYLWDSVNKKVLKAEGPTSPCTPTDYYPITGDDISVTDFSLSPVSTAPENITITIQGSIKDPLGDHPFNFQTNVVPRVSL